MGQYWRPVNLDKKEYINPHQLASGLKLWEQLANPGVGRALVILCAAMPEHRGGGDLDLDENWHGPERTLPEHSCTSGPVSDVYQTIAHRTIGRWAGDRIALVGDYAEDGDLHSKAGDVPASQIYGLCDCTFSTYKDITADVRRVIEHELCGKFSEGPGWCQWEEAA